MPSPLISFNLACVTREGQGCKKDPERAFELCKSSAEQGFQKAKRYFCALCKQGLGTEKDKQQAAIWQCQIDTEEGVSLKSNDPQIQTKDRFGLKDIFSRKKRNSFFSENRNPNSDSTSKVDPEKTGEFIL